MLTCQINIQWLTWLTNVHLKIGQCKLTLDVSDMHWKSNLASQKNTFEWNKNKIWSLEGINANVRNENKMNDTLNSCITAEVCEQVFTADLYPILDGHCDPHNILQFSECGDDHVPMDSQKFLTNYINNQVHTLGFCPLGPLHLNTGNPVQWNSTLTDLEAHWLIKDSGKPNFLGCRIPFDSHLNIFNWRSYWLLGFSVARSIRI